MKINKIFYLFLSTLFFISCNKENKKEANVHNKGEITLQYDDSYSNIAKALANRYEQNYPNTKIYLESTKEDLALENLLNKKVDIIIMSRELTEKEMNYWNTNIKLPWQPSYFAADAVCFIANKSSTKEYISLEEIKNMLNSQDRNLIVEGGYTSNFNTIIQKLNLDPHNVYFSQAKSNEDIIKSLEKHHKHIGIISYNTISHPYSKKIKDLKENIKILPIRVGDSLIYPNKENLKSQKYPFTKLLYFITKEKKFGLANGFIRYSCTNIGQKIVSKEGLQPFFIFPRTIKINTQK